MKFTSGISIFWIVLAVFYLSLAISTYIRSRPIQSDLRKLAKEGPDNMISLKDGVSISLNDNIYLAFKNIIITDIIGFILASIAAIITLII